MGSYAENEQDAREHAEWQRQFAEEKLEEARELAKEKPVVTMDEIMEHRGLRRAEENAERHMKGQETWTSFMEKTNNGEDFERNDQQDLIIMEIHQIVDNNILYGSPPYSLESAEEILLDILNDLTSMKERLGLGGNI